MKVIHSYPKVWNVGHPRVSDITKYPVSVQEKVDGSQFSWTKDPETGLLSFRSKNAEVFQGQEGLFHCTVDALTRIADRFTPGYIYRGEALSKCKHNALTYNRTPKHNVVLFDVEVSQDKLMPPDELEDHGRSLDLEVVPIFAANRMLSSVDDVLELLETESFLGGPKIEGIVLKSYHMWTADGKPMMAKYVSPEFKEVNREAWGKANPSKKSEVEMLGEGLRTEARWRKSIQHALEDNRLESSPRDIGLLIRLIQEDIVEEEKEVIKERLWKAFHKDLLRKSTAGFPEFYKQLLLEKQFDTDGDK